MKTEMIEEVFTYHAPSAAQIPFYGALRDKAKELALLIQEACPESREKSLAITHVQEAVMFANAAIAIHTSPAPPTFDPERSATNTLNAALAEPTHAFPGTDDPGQPTPIPQEPETPAVEGYVTP